MPIPPPSPEGEVAPESDPDESDDDGPGGMPLGDAPVEFDGYDPQRDAHPDEDSDGHLGLASVEYRLDRQSNFSASKPRSRVPGPGQLLARTTQNLDTMEYFEDRRVVVGWTKDELTQKLPLTGRRKTCSVRVVLYYDPEYVPVTRVWVGGIRDLLQPLRSVCRVGVS